jgi:phage gpG-like protein
MVAMRFAGDGFDPFTTLLTRFQQRVEDAEPAFQKMADHFATMNKKQFGTEGGHYGGGWSPLKPDYGQWKANVRPGKPILEFDGLLRESLTQRPFGVDEVTGTGMVVGTGLEYARYHQDGTANMDARPLLGEPTSEDTKLWAKMMHEFIIDGDVRS